MRKARYRKHSKLDPRSAMNKTEAAYASLLSSMVQKGEIVGFKYTPIKLRLANNCYYIPDFMVLNKNGEVEFHEVKGFWRDDARVKIKVAAEEYPEFLFLAVRWVKKRWEEERF